MILWLLTFVEILIALGLMAAMPVLGAGILLMTALRWALAGAYRIASRTLPARIEARRRRARETAEETGHSLPRERRLIAPGDSPDQAGRDRLLRTLAGAPLAILFVAAGLIAGWFALLAWGLPAEAARAAMASAGDLHRTTATLFPAARSFANVLAIEGRLTEAALAAHLAGHAFWFMVAAIWSEALITLHVLRLQPRYAGAKRLESGLLGAAVFLALALLVLFVALGYVGLAPLQLEILLGERWAILVLAGLLPLTPALIAAIALAQIIERSAGRNAEIETLDPEGWLL